MPELQQRIETPAGAAVWRHLEWDSEQFGIAAARLDSLVAPGPYAQAYEAKLELLARVLDSCRSAGVRHLCARVEAGDLSGIHALEQAGFRLIDGIQTFRRELTGRADAAPSGTRLFRQDDLDEVLAIARTSFLYDRFHADAALAPGVADRVNEAWTRNCCSGRAADAVVIAERNGRVASYVTCRLDRVTALGTIVLVATAEGARGQGAARDATQASLAWFAQQQAESVEVGTQLRNIPAARLYEGAGFRLSGASLTFRIVL